MHYDLSCVGLFEMSSALENVKIILYKNKCVILPKLLPFVYMPLPEFQDEITKVFFMDFRVVCTC